MSRFRTVTVSLAALLCALLAGTGVASAQYPPGPPPPSPTPPFVPAPGPPRIIIETPGAIIIIEGRDFGEDVDPPPVTVIRKHGAQAQTIVETADVRPDGSFTVEVPVPEGDGELSVSVVGVGRDGAVHLLEGGPGDTVLSTSGASKDSLLAAGVDEETLVAMGVSADPSPWPLALGVVLVLGLAAGLGLAARRRFSPTG